MSDHEQNMVVLSATVEMRLDACRRMVAAQSNETGATVDKIAYEHASELHRFAARVANRHRPQ